MTMPSTLPRFPLNRTGLVLAVCLHAGIALTAEQTGQWYGFSVDFREALQAGFLFCIVGLYALVLHRLQQGRTVPLRHIILAMVLSAAPYVLNFLTKSSDIFNYIAYAEISQHGSPYLQGAASLGPAHPIYHGVWDQWRPHPSPYGPVWMGIVVLVGKLHTTFVAQMAIFKAIGAFMLLSIATLLVRHRPLPLAAAVLFNPMVIIEFIGDGHNDSVFAFLLLLSVLYAVRPVLSGAAFGLSVATKHVSVFVSPLYVAWYLQQRKYRHALLGLASAGVAVGVMYAALWVGPKMFDGILLVGRQFYATPWFFPQKILFSIFRTLDLHLSIYQLLQLGVTIGTGIAVLCIGWLFWRVWKRHMELSHAVFYGLSAVIFFAMQWVQPWYLTWPLVLIPFLPTKHVYRYAMIITLAWFAMYYTLY